MIGLNRQRKNLPAFLGTLLLDKGLAILCNSATKHGFAALGAPDQVVDDKVDAVFIPLIVHVEIIAYNNTLNNSSALERRLKPGQAPNHYC